MLFIPMAVGLAAAHGPSAAALLFLPALVLLFLARAAALSAARHFLSRGAAPGRVPRPGFFERHAIWSVFYLGASLALLIAALTSTPSATLTPTMVAVATVALLGGCQTLLALFGRGRSIGAEVIGMAGLATTAPLIVFASGRPPTAASISSGVIVLIYFLSSLSCVRAYRVERKAGGNSRRGDIIFHLALTGLLAGLWRVDFISSLVLLAFIPVFARTAWGLAFPPPNLAALGRREVVISILFTLAACIAFAG